MRPAGLIIIQGLFQTHIVHIQAPYTHIKLKKLNTARAILALIGETHIIFYSFTYKMPQ